MDVGGHFRIGAMVALSAGVCLVAGGTWAAGGGAKTLFVEAGEHARACVPMCVELPAGAAEAKKARMTDAAKEVPCQVADGRLWWILDELAAGANRAYVVDIGADSPARARGVELRQGDEAIDITIDGQPFTSYIFQYGKPGGSQLRRPYFWPVLGPGQTPMTRPYPLTTDLAKNVTKDHPHHTSIWVAHGAINGVDNWSNADKAGWQVHKEFQAIISGPVVGTFREALDWTSANRKPNLAEVRTARIYRLPDTARMIDLEVCFQAKYGAVIFGDTKEGGICATRMRDEFRMEKGQNGRLVNARGQTGGAAWGKPAEWVDCSGPIEGRTLGYAVFDAPGNLRYPTTWHARTYGLVTANPFGLAEFDKAAGKKGDHTLEADKELVFRYRIYLHAGDEKEAKVAARCVDYASPPKATWR